MLLGLSLFCVVGAICSAVFWRNSSILYPTHHRGHLGDRDISITFDDGPDPEYTPRALDVLSEYGVKATFFCLGNRVDVYPDIASRIHREGHLLANHGYDHALRDFFRPPGPAHQLIVKSGLTIRDITGYFPRFYRPPVGIKTPPRILSLFKLGLVCVGWTRSGSDGGRNVLTPERARGMAARVSAGDIVLLHDGRTGAMGARVVCEPSQLDAFEQALRTLLTTLREKGLNPVCVDELLGLPRGLDSVPAAATSASWPLLKAPLKALLTEKASPPLLGASLGVGVLIGCSPFFGIHGLVGLLFALKFRLHKAGVLVGTNVSNPLFAPFVIWGCLQTGCLILTGDSLPLSLEDLESADHYELVKRFLTYWLVGFPVFGAAIGLLVGFAVCALGLLRQFWLTVRRRVQ